MSGGPPRVAPDAAAHPAPAVAWPRRVLVLAGLAIALRLLLFLGRGDYLAFDEGFYLLLGRSLVTGEGYSLVGIPHIALSPLFPLLAGSAGAVLGSWVWGGRVVAALAAGLLVLPAWAVFRRLAPARVAFVGCVLIAVLPSLAPFVVPFWIGADLWVGAEPLLHLLLYTGLAAWLWADERGGAGRWAGVGAAFGLAFLARPEAIITWGLLGLASLALAARRRSGRRLAGAAVMGLAFVLVASPYWLYLHGVTGRWALTGRGVAPAAAAAQLVRTPEARGDPGAAGTIERMLWADDDAYERMLYSLDDSGLRLRNPYWGVYPESVATADDGAADAPDRAVDGEADAAADDAAASASGASGASGTGPTATVPPGSEGAAGGPSRVRLFLDALRMILPLLLWLFVILGVVRPRSRAVLRKELPVSLSLAGTSLAIAALVAVDPRTQLFLVPLLAFYAARGFETVEDVVQRRVEGGALQPGFVELLLASVAVVWLLGIDARRLQLSLLVGSPHHVVAEQNRHVAEELDRLLPEASGPVMSWHPALAVYADRDWRVLPMAGLREIIRYGEAAGAGVAVLSAYYPPDLKVESLDTRYLLLPLPRDLPDDQWSLRVESGDSIRRVGRIEPPDAPPPAGGGTDAAGPGR